MAPLNLTDRIFTAIVPAVLCSLLCGFYAVLWTQPLPGIVAYTGIFGYSVITIYRGTNSWVAKIAQSATGLSMITELCLMYSLWWSSRLSGLLAIVFLIIIYKIYKLFLKPVSYYRLFVAATLNTVLFVVLVTRPHSGRWGPGFKIKRGPWKTEIASTGVYRSIAYSVIDICKNPHSIFRIGIPNPRGLVPEGRVEILIQG